MKVNDLSRLKDLAGLMLDNQLAHLRKTAEAKAQSEEALARLGQQTEAQAQDLEGMAAALAGLAYQRWADARRTEINLVLARQTHDWLDARAAAQAAFGKAEALRRLAEKQRRNS